MHRSIYGLSYDVYILEIWSRLISIYCTLHYLLSPLVRSQYAARFPLFYPLEAGITLPISLLLLLQDCMVIVCALTVLRQLTYYRSSKHIFQGLSYILLFTLGFIVCFTIFTYTCACHNLPYRNSGRFGIFYIEHINYLWVFGNLLAAVKYLPQVSLNWMGNSTVGVSSKYVLINLFSSILFLTGYILWTPNEKFYEISFNIMPMSTGLTQFVLLVGLFYQAQFKYFGSKPFLPKGK